MPQPTPTFFGDPAAQVKLASLRLHPDPSKRFGSAELVLEDLAPRARCDIRIWTPCLVAAVLLAVYAIRPGNSPALRPVRLAVLPLHTTDCESGPISGSLYGGSDRLQRLQGLVLIPISQALGNNVANFADASSKLGATQKGRDLAALKLREAPADAYARSLVGYFAIRLGDSQAGRDEIEQALRLDVNGNPVPLDDGKTSKNTLVVKDYDEIRGRSNLREVELEFQSQTPFSVGIKTGDARFRAVGAVSGTFLYKCTLTTRDNKQHGWPDNPNGGGAVEVGSGSRT